jgi:opacity protein-like surface antigen
MVISHRSIVAGGVLLLVVSAAGAAADYYDGAGAAPSPIIAPASWYVRGDVGYDWMDAGELRGVISPFGAFSTGNTWSIGGSIGCFFGRGVRGDIAYECRDSSDVHGRGTFATDFMGATSVILANLYYDFRPYERFRPYVGVASSGAITTTCGSVCPQEGDSNWSAAGAVMAGISNRLDHGTPAASIKDTPVYEPGCVHLDVGYRFFYLGDAFTGNLIHAVQPAPGLRLDDGMAHELRVGLRWDVR